MLFLDLLADLYLGKCVRVIMYMCLCVRECAFVYLSDLLIIILTGGEKNIQGYVNN